MNITIGQERLIRLLEKQLNSLYEWEEEEGQALRKIFPLVLERIEHCFLHSGDNKYYVRDNGVTFDPYHTAQYAIFLYYVANTLWRQKLPASCATKVYSLNKALNCLDIYFEVTLPEVFYTDHPVGTVLGRAQYGNRFRFVQNCTVGNNHGIYPVIGESVTMHTGSSILGSSRIGDRAIISAHTYIKDQDVPPDVIVFGKSPQLVFKPRTDLSDNATTAR